MSNGKALVILSGGMDSTTLLHDVANGYAVPSILALTFDYGSKHNKKEIRQAKYNCKVLGIEHIIIRMQDVFKHFKSSLLESGDDIPEGHYKDSSMKSTVVPFRNGILLSIAAGIAESKSISKVFYGAHAGDHAIYPDCTDEFAHKFNEATQLGTYNNVEIYAPYEGKNKIDIIKKGIAIGVDYGHTWTCYKGKENPCGKCGSCVERTEAFIKNDLKDPLYTDKQWKEAVEFYNKSK